MENCDIWMDKKVRKKQYSIDKINKGQSKRLRGKWKKMINKL